MSDVETVTQADLVAIVSVALGNPIRTTVQQDALVRVCKQMDNDFVQWSADAGDTWEGNRCTCGRAIPVMADTCGDCRSEAATTWVVTCPDGVVRHDPFASRGDAERWTAWGHCCLTVADHRFQEVQP